MNSGGASIVLLALLLSFMPFAKTMADEVETVHLKSAADWEAFANRVDKGEVTLNAVMDNDIDLGDCQAMVGNSHYYEGTFDGKGHALTVHYNNSSSQNTAPFSYVDGTTINNLIIKGEIIANYEAFAPIIGGIISTPKADSEKTNKISNCAVFAKLQSDCETMSSYIGGFVGLAQASFTIDNSLFAGNISAANGNVLCGKFTTSTWSKCNYIISNTLFLGKLPSEAYTKDYIKSNNVYEYEETEENRFPAKFATQVTADQLTSGELSLLLNTNNDNPVWGQAFDQDASPVPFGAKVVTEQSDITEATEYHITNGTNWRTLIYPRDTKAGEDLRIFTVNGVNSDNVLVFKELTSGTIPANTPVVLYKNPEATDATTAFTLQPYSYRNDAPTTSYLRGVYADTTAPVGSYVLQKHAGEEEPAFYKVAGTQPTVKPYNCYLEVEQGSNAKSFSFPFSGTTGIKGINADNASNFGDGKVYTLDGKQVSHMEKGKIYIVNGKKFIIK